MLFKNILINLQEYGVIYDSGIMMCSSVILCRFQKQAIIGVLLGDAYIERVKITHNSRLRLEQTYPGHSSYLWHLYSVFANLTGNILPKSPTRKLDKRTGKIYESIAFKTRNLSCLNFYQEIFYVNGVKVVPANIAEFLTPISLAYWIMDDGSINFYGQTVLHTNAFTLNDLEILCKALKDNFGLNSRVSKERENQ